MMFLEGSQNKVSFSNHVLLVETREYRDEIRIWPKPEAWRMDRQRTRIFRIHPKFEFGRGAHEAEVGLLFADAPPEWAEVNVCFYEDPWAGIEFLHRGKNAALDLCRNNPGLVTALFVRRGTWSSEYPGRNILQVVRRLSGPQSGFLNLLNLPSERRWINLFRKMDVELIYEAPLEAWLPICGRKPFWPLLSHAKRLGVQLLPFCHNPEWVEEITPRCFLEVLESDLSQEAIYGYFEEYFTGKEKGGMRLPAPRSFPHLQLQLKDIRTNRRHQSRLKYHKVPLPSPPLSTMRGLKPLQETDAVIRESEQMHNCVYELLEDILEGGYYLYAMTFPERCTAGVVWDESGGWRVDQVRKACNQSPEPGTLDFVVDQVCHARVLRSDTACVAALGVLAMRTAPTNPTRG